MYSVKIIADSISPIDIRLTTFELTYPRIIHNELMTHRMFSRNSSSSRAIPNSKLREKITTDPVVPVYWGKNQKGMQADEEIKKEKILGATQIWLGARDLMLEASEKLAELGVHKQISNRLIEPWMYITVLVTATDYANWFKLRDSDKAQPEIAKLARMMRFEYKLNKPIRVEFGYWHLPYISNEERDKIKIGHLLLVSVARCARVSTLTHDNIYDIDRDIKLAQMLKSEGHWSPFEHQAYAKDTTDYIGNFRGWLQFRKFHLEEYVNE